MTAVNQRPHQRPRRRKAVIGAVLLAPLVLLGARRAVRATALSRNQSPRGPLVPERLGTIRPTAAAATSTPAGATRSAAVGALRPAEPNAPERRKRKSRTLRLALAAASLALLGAFIQYAQSRVPRPSFAPESPANRLSASQARPRSIERPKSPASVVHSHASGVVPASPAPTRQRSSTRVRGPKLRPHHAKHQSRAGLTSGRRPAQPVAPAKHTRHRPVSRAHVVAARTGHRLRWNAVAGATYYNLVLWRDGKRVLDLWPTSPRVAVPTASVNHGSQARLSPGRYLWFVYPGFGAKPARNYGALVGTGVLVVQPKGG
jgi:hypothetical protein